MDFEIIEIIYAVTLLTATEIAIIWYLIKKLGGKL